MRLLNRPREVIRLLDPSQECWSNARIVIRDGKADLETYWRSREVYGTYTLTYWISPRCLRQLFNNDLIEPDEAIFDGAKVYKLSDKGKERLRKT